MIRRIAAALGIVGILFLPPGVVSAHLPTLVSQIDLPGDLLTVRATPDGRRVLALLARPPGEAAQKLLIVDVIPDTPPLVAGMMSVDGIVEQLAIARDGRSALIVTGTGDSNLPVNRRLVIAVDLRDPVTPILRNVQDLDPGKRFRPQTVVLASDAMIYAFTKPSTVHSMKSQILVRRLAEPADGVTFETKSMAPAMVLSPDGRYLAYGESTYSVGAATVVDLQAVPAKSFAQPNSDYQDRYACLLAVLASGHLLLDDTRAPRAAHRHLRA